VATNKDSAVILPTPLDLINGFWLKREDLNPSGSVKDRAIVKQLLAGIRQGKRKFAISTSGNAGISLAYWSEKLAVESVIFVSPSLTKPKLAELKRLKANLIVTPRPISDGWRFARQKKFVWLRQSEDPLALEGFIGLGKELDRQIKDSGNGLPDCLFVPLSSGTTFLGVYNGLSATVRKKIRFFFVQSAFRPILAAKFDQDFYSEKDNLTDALVARVIPKKEEIISIVKRTSGSGVVVQNAQIRQANDWLKKHGVNASSEAGAILAAYWKCLKRKVLSPLDKPLFLITGKKR
jgi:threonine synthase